MGVEKRFHWQIKFPRDHQLLCAVFGMNLYLPFHAVLFFGLIDFYHGFQFGKSVVPHCAEGFDKVGFIRRLVGIQAVIDFPAVLLLIEQVAFGENLQVF